MATKNFSQMTTKKLNALLETANEQDKAQIQAVLETRAAAQAAPAPINSPVYVGEEEPLTPEEQAMLAEAEANNGINPVAEKAKKATAKMSDEERSELAKKLKETTINHRCQVVPFNSAEWVNGMVAGIIEEKRSNKVLYAIKTDDGRRIVKVHGSELVKILDEVVEPVKVSRSRQKDASGKTVKTEWLQEEIDAAINACIVNVGKEISYPKFSIAENKSNGEFEYGRITSLVPDRRGKRILYRIEVNQTDDEKAAKAEKKYVHKVSTNPDLVIAEELDETGKAINEAYASRRTKAAEKNALTPQDKVALAEAALEKAKKALAEAQKMVEKREAMLNAAKEELAKYLDSQLEQLDNE